MARSLEQTNLGGGLEADFVGLFGPDRVGSPGFVCGEGKQAVTSDFGCGFAHGEEEGDKTHLVTASPVKLPNAVVSSLRAHIHPPRVP